MHILPMGSMGPSVRGNRCLLSPLHPGKKGQTFSTKVHTCAPPRIRVDTSPLSLDNEGGRRRKKRFSIGGRGGGKKKNFSVSRFFKGCSPFFFFFSYGKTTRWNATNRVVVHSRRKKIRFSQLSHGRHVHAVAAFLSLLRSSFFRRDYHQVWLPRVVKLFVRDDWLIFLFRANYFRSFSSLCTCRGELVLRTVSFVAW